jgi:cytochrome c-type biogenesis protein CcmH/NrfG
MTRRDLIILLGCAAIGLGAYLYKGSPGSGDLPMSARLDALDAKIKSNPDSLTRDELMTRLESEIVRQPDAPEPHFFIGQLLASEGRYEDAARAFQAALRRKSDSVPALIALADAMTDSAGGEVSASARSLYKQAYSLDPTQIESGMRAAMGAAQAGDEATARKEMIAIYEALPADAPERERYKPMYEALMPASD